MIRIVVEGFTLGLATGVYCLTACAPFFLPYMIAENEKNGRANLWLIIRFLSGRLTAYILFAIVVSFAGAHFKNYIPAWIIQSAVILTALLMLFYALSIHFPRMNICKKIVPHFGQKQMPFLLGFLIGINICPPFIQGLLSLISIGNIFLGILFFIAFFFGTTLYTLPILTITFFQKTAQIKNIGVIASILAGVWFLFTGILNLL